MVLMAQARLKASSTCLGVLGARPLHGLWTADRIAQVTGGALQIEAGSISSVTGGT